MMFYGVLLFPLLLLVLVSMGWYACALYVVLMMTGGVLQLDAAEIDSSYSLLLLFACPGVGGSSGVPFHIGVVGMGAVS